MPTNAGIFSAFVASFAGEGLFKGGRGSAATADVRRVRPVGGSRRGRGRCAHVTDHGGGLGRARAIGPGVERRTPVSVRPRLFMGELVRVPRTGGGDAGPLRLAVSAERVIGAPGSFVRSVRLGFRCAGTEDGCERARRKSQRSHVHGIGAEAYW